MEKKENSGSCSSPSTDELLRGVGPDVAPPSKPKLDKPATLDRLQNLTHNKNVPDKDKEKLTHPSRKRYVWVSRHFLMIAAALLVILINSQVLAT